MAKPKNEANVETKDKATEEPKVEKDPVAETYEMYRTKHPEADLAEWGELNTPVQQLWRDGYTHVAEGGSPRTAYEEIVSSLITFGK